MKKTTNKTNNDELESLMSCRPKRETSLLLHTQNVNSIPSNPSNENESSSEQSSPLASSHTHTSSDEPRPLTHKRADRIIGVSKKGIAIGEFSPHAKYTDRECDEVFRLREEGLTFREIGKILDMPKPTVWAIYTGKRRGHVIAMFKRK